MPLIFPGFSSRHTIPSLIVTSPLHSPAKACWLPNLPTNRSEHTLAYDSDATRNGHPKALQPHSILPACLIRTSNSKWNLTTLLKFTLLICIHVLILLLSITPSIINKVRELRLLVYTRSRDDSTILDNINNDLPLELWCTAWWMKILAYKSSMLAHKCHIREGTFEISQKVIPPLHTVRDLD